jgi:conjugative transfer signal peptidase TraF
MANHDKCFLARFYPICMAVFVFIAVIVILKCLSTIFVFQVTRSMPAGIYKIVPPTEIHKGQCVIFDIPDSVRQMVKNRKWAPPRVSLLMKEIFAVPGDKISITENGVFINDILLGPVKRFDHHGMPLPVIRKEFTLQNGEYFVACRSENSFDSRYFGPIRKRDIKAVVEPFLIFND